MNPNAAGSNDVGNNICDDSAAAEGDPRTQDDTARSEEVYACALDLVQYMLEHMDNLYSPQFGESVRKTINELGERSFGNTSLGFFGTHPSHCVDSFEP